nr:MAG TPA: 14-3-3 protein gamma [Caudoviricetes sp.]
MCVACTGFPVICRSCPGYISIRDIQLYCDMLV